MGNSFNKIQLENTIRENEDLLETIKSKDCLLYRVKLQRTLFVLATIFFLIVMVLFYFLKHKKLEDSIVSQKRIIEQSLLEKDSLSIYKEGYFKNMEAEYPLAQEKEESLEDIEILYGVQIGAFKDFDLVSENLAHLHKGTSQGYSKYCIGNYKTYEEASLLKSKLNGLGFKGAFISAKSFGKPINIKKALIISKEE